MAAIRAVALARVRLAAVERDEVSWKFDDGTQLGVAVIPGRKSMGFYVLREGKLTVLAYFRSGEAAFEAKKLLDRLALGTVDSQGEWEVKP